jgi:uncharacterized membrane protein
MSVAAFEAKETARLEAFSDGVFPFAMTLLVLGLRDPTGAPGTLLIGMLTQWPTFFAFVTSFTTILIMWVNHHNMFNYISRIDKPFMFLNGALLFFITLTPFTTSLVADHVISTDARTAAGVYSGTFTLLSIAWNVLWRHASAENKLLGKHVTRNEARSITRQYYVAPLFYSIAFLVSLLNALASVAVIFLVAAFYAVTATTSTRR